MGQVGGVGLGGQGGCVHRIEGFEKIKENGGGGGRGLGVSGWGCSGWGIRVDVNEELKIL